MSAVDSTPPAPVPVVEVIEQDTAESEDIGNIWELMVG